jgi:ribosomal protein L7/L12
MAELPRVYLVQGADAPQHINSLKRILQEMVSDKRIIESQTLNVFDDPNALQKLVKPNDMIISLLTHGMEGKKPMIDQMLTQAKAEGVKIVEILIDHLVYNNDFITFPSDLKPIRSREDMDSVWAGIENHLKEIFPKQQQPAPEPPPPPPEQPKWKKYTPFVLALLLVVALGYIFLNNNPTPVKVEPATEVTIANEAFRMPIEDVFSISGRGTVVTGKIASGTVKQGQAAVITSPGVELKTMVTEIEISRQSVSGAKTGDNVGILLRGITRDQVRKGMVLESVTGPRSYVIMLQEIGDQKIQVIKIVRTFTGLGLKESKDLVESAPVKIWSTSSRGEVRKIVEELEKVGAVVNVE